MIRTHTIIRKNRFDRARRMEWKDLLLKTRERNFQGGEKKKFVEMTKKREEKVETIL